MYANYYRKLLGLFFAIGWVSFGFLSYQLLITDSREHNLSKIELIMNVANAVRANTAEDLKPEPAEHANSRSFAHSAPSFAATNVINRLPDQYKAYKYREVSLKPMYPRNSADAWETELLVRLSSKTANDKEIGEIEVGQQRFVYIARPIRMNGKGCLSCHGHVEDGPVQLIKVRGSENRFDWKTNDVVAAQIGMVPISDVNKQITKNFLGYLFVVAGFLLVLLVAVDQTVSHSQSSRRRFLAD